MFTFLSKDWCRRGGKSVSVSVKAEETGTLFLKVSLYESALPVLDQKYKLFVTTIELMIKFPS